MVCKFPKPICEHLRGVCHQCAMQPGGATPLQDLAGLLTAHASIPSDLLQNPGHCERRVFTKRGGTLPTSLFKLIMTIPTATKNNPWSPNICKRRREENHGGTSVYAIGMGP